ncbi:MAG: O-antigen ligase family protein [Flavobacteriaceae bacterium]|nr:O-antigen ligase family protein [Flavobacteriaceae bacterium]
MNSYKLSVSSFLSISFILIVILGDLEAGSSNVFVVYFKYIILILPLAFLFIYDSRLYWNVQFLWPFFFIVIWSFIFNLNATVMKLATSIVILIPCIFYISGLKFKIRDNQLNVLFVWLGIYFLILKFNSIVSLSFDSFMLSGKSSEVESFLFPFILGFICLYFLLSNKKKNFVFFLILIFLTGKRSVFLAINIVLFIKIFNLQTYLLKYKVLIGLLLNFVGLFVLFLFSNSFFNELFFELFGIKSIGAFSAGRSSIYSFIYSFYEGLTLYSQLFGIGFGSLQNYIGDFFFLDSGWNAHNDILRLLVELGFFGLCVFIVLIYKKLNEDQFIVVIFFNVLLFFTNSLIFPVVLFYFLLIMFLRNDKKLNQYG